MEVLEAHQAQPQQERPGLSLMQRCQWTCVHTSDQTTPRMGLNCRSSSMIASASRDYHCMLLTCCAVGETYPRQTPRGASRGTTRCQTPHSHISQLQLLGTLSPPAADPLCCCWVNRSSHESLREDHSKVLEGPGTQQGLPG